MCILPVEFRWPEMGVAFPLASGLDPSSVEHSAAEGGLVEGSAGDRFMNDLEVAQGEQVGEQGKCDRAVAELALQPLVRGFKDDGMVERQRFVIVGDGGKSQIEPSVHRLVQQGMRQ